MNAKQAARTMVLLVALAGAYGVLRGVVNVGIAGLAVIAVNGAVVGWLKWHEEQSPEHRR